MALPASPPVAVPTEIGLLRDVFTETLRARNRSAMTIKSYREAIDQLGRFLAAKGMPTTIEAITREHVSAFLTDQLARLKPASAANRYRSLQQFFRFCVDEGEIKSSPMERMRPPDVPETPPAVLSDADIRKLLDACSGRTFEDRRDYAIVRLMLDTGRAVLRLRGSPWPTSTVRRERRFCTARAADRESWRSGTRRCSRSCATWANGRSTSSATSRRYGWVAGAR